MAEFHDMLPPGTRMNRGDTLFSRQRTFRLDMQTDGNFVLYNAGMGVLWVPEWRSYRLQGDRLTIQDRERVFGRGDFAWMQTDGNLVVYDAAMTPLFHTGTYGNPGAFLVCQDDGNLVIYQGGAPASVETALWATQTHAGPSG